MLMPYYDFLYVVDAARGRKVGYSNQPRKRICNIRRTYSAPDAEIVHLERLWFGDIQSAEWIAHRALRHSSIGGEWFSASVQECVNAVEIGVKSEHSECIDLWRDFQPTGEGVHRFKQYCKEIGRRPNSFKFGWL